MHECTGCKVVSPFGPRSSGSGGLFPWLSFLHYVASLASAQQSTAARAAATRPTCGVLYCARPLQSAICTCCVKYGRPRPPNGRHFPPFQRSICAPFALFSRTEGSSVPCSASTLSFSSWDARQLGIRTLALLHTIHCTAFSGWSGLASAPPPVPHLLSSARAAVHQPLLVPT